MLKLSVAFAASAEFHAVEVTLLAVSVEAILNLVEVRLIKLQ